MRRLDEHRVMLTADFIDAVAEALADSFVRIEDAAVEAELDDGLRSIECVDHTVALQRVFVQHRRLQCRTHSKACHASPPCELNARMKQPFALIARCTLSRSTREEIRT